MAGIGPACPSPPPDPLLVEDQIDRIGRIVSQNGACRQLDSQLCIDPQVTYSAAS